MRALKLHRHSLARAVIGALAVILAVTPIAAVAQTKIKMVLKCFEGSASFSERFVRACHPIRQLRASPVWTPLTSSSN